MLTIARFEVARRLRQLSTWVYFIVFFALALLWVAAAGGAFRGANIVFASGKVWINSPYAIQQTLGFLGMMAVTVIGAIMGRAVQQDYEYRSETFFFTAPIRRWEYLGGRFTGAFVTTMLVLGGLGLGAWAGTLLPNIPADRLGPPRLAAYLLPYATTLAPNVFWLGCVCFCLGALTRRMLPIYVTTVLALIAYLVAGSLLRDLDNKTLAALLDPFGLTAVSRITEYWPIADRNTRLVPLTGVLAANRLAWIGVGVCVLALTAWRFKFGEARGAKSAKAVHDDADDAVRASARFVPTALARRSAWTQLPRLTWLYFRETVRNLYFGVFVLAGVAFMIAASTTMGSLFGTNTWPVTYQILGLIEGTFSVFMLVIITFYAGELAWRERDNRLDQIQDALPVPTWLPLAAKLLALMLIPLVLQAVLMLCGIAIQTAKGYHHYELGQYVRRLFGIGLVDYWLVCALALAVQSIVNQKYLGHFVMIVYYVALVAAIPLGFEHGLYLYGETPQVTYSDMNGFGHFMLRARAFQAYYGAWALLLVIVAYLAWTRGTTSDWRGRLVVARSRFTPRVAAAAGVVGVLIAATGGYIFYNTNILNRYETAYDGEQRQADYEKRYRALLADPQPKITDVKLRVELYPLAQRVRATGTYTLVNRTSQPVTRVHLMWMQGADEVIHALRFDRAATLATDDMQVGVQSYAFAEPLPPGGETVMTFDVEVPTHGFVNAGSNTSVVYNGTFVNGQFMLPTVGYDERGELTLDRDRVKFGLKPRERKRDRDDPAGPAYNYLTHAADFITFEAEVVTDADQYAIAPGYLIRDWTDGDRRHFLYRMDSPILDFFAFQSARYAVKKDRWHDVAIEVYYQPGHEYNLDRMIAAVKASLDYYTTNFGPYQHRQFRIVEFPRYAAFAQAFPNTIPFSEGIGFIARVRENDKDDIDYPYYVTAHEAAHQWWAHQVIGADVQGATMLSETLAQYSALMVMKQKYGPAKMQKFLAYELDRYLIGRAGEQKKELPLARVEDQAYIHYRKGSLVMYALADAIGEERLNRAIRRFRDDYAFKGPPYPTTTQFLKYVREETPPQWQYLIDDLFETITLYDNRAVRAEARPLAGGRYAVTLSVIAKKRRADELGKETDVPLADWIDVGVLDAEGNPLYLEKKHIESNEATFTVEVAGKPARAGIDPLNKLIDRDPKDNTVAVDVDGG
ncbi:MAG: hypothetical protein JSR18_01305 [Proteobacteria bacterium]|nr:hypothetical protein [Pseudomonadota bacterium]